MNWFCLTCQTTDLDMHSSIPSSDSTGTYVIKSDPALKAQVNYMKRWSTAHSFHFCYTVVSPSLYLWPHKGFPIITLLRTLYSQTHRDFERKSSFLFISILRKLKYRMGNNLPRTIQLQLCYDTNLIPTFPFDKHAILYFLKIHTAEVGELSFSLAVIFSKFLFSLLENKIVWGKVREEIKLCIQKIL